MERKVALITGGGTGIGRATAERLAAQGCAVVVAGRREGPLQVAAASAPDLISYVKMDLANEDDQDEAIATVIARHGRLDMLVNNAATQKTGLFVDHSRDDIISNVHVNLTSTMLLTHKAIPHLIKVKGSIVMVSSAAARYQGMPPAQLSAYSASKAGLNQFTKVIATELGPQGVRVNAVAPGFTDTEIAAEGFSNKDLVDYIISITPLRRTANPDDVASVVVWLLGEDAGWVTGQIVDATGGLWLA